MPKFSFVEFKPHFLFDLNDIRETPCKVLPETNSSIRDYFLNGALTILAPLEPIESKKVYILLVLDLLEEFQPARAEGQKHFDDVATSKLARQVDVTVGIGPWGQGGVVGELGDTLCFLEQAPFCSHAWLLFE